MHTLPPLPDSAGNRRRTASGPLGASSGPRGNSTPQRLADEEDNLLSPDLVQDNESAPTDGLTSDTPNDSSTVSDSLVITPSMKELVGNEVRRQMEEQTLCNASPAIVHTGLFVATCPHTSTYAKEQSGVTGTRKKTGRRVADKWLEYLRSKGVVTTSEKAEHNGKAMLQRWSNFFGKGGVIQKLIHAKGIKTWMQTKDLHSKILNATSTAGNHASNVDSTTDPISAYARELRKQISRLSIEMTKADEDSTPMTCLSIQVIYTF